MKFVKNSQRFRATTSARVRMHKHTQYTRTAMRSGSDSLQCLDRFIEMFGTDECKGEKPQSAHVLRFYGQHSAQFPNGLVVAASIKENPADIGTGKRQRGKLR